jgi:hypothetical protein
MIWLHAHPLSPSSVMQRVASLSPPSCVSQVQLTDDRVGGGEGEGVDVEPNHDRKIAWPSVIVQSSLGAGMVISRILAAEGVKGALSQNQKSSVFLIYVSRVQRLITD